MGSADSALGKSPLNFGENPPPEIDDALGKFRADNRQCEYQVTVVDRRKLLDQIDAGRTLANTAIEINEAYKFDIEMR